MCVCDGTHLPSGENRTVKTSEELSEMVMAGVRRCVGWLPVGGHDGEQGHQEISGDVLGDKGLVAALSGHRCPRYDPHSAARSHRDTGQLTVGSEGLTC
jgi:hypothetical protein